MLKHRRSKRTIAIMFRHRDMPKQYFQDCSTKFTKGCKISWSKKHARMSSLSITTAKPLACSRCNIVTTDILEEH
jgi:hypothetical protein